MSFTECRARAERVEKPQLKPDVLLYSILLCSVDGGNVSHTTGESCYITCGTTEFFSDLKHSKLDKSQSQILKIHGELFIKTSVAQSKPEIFSLS